MKSRKDKGSVKIWELDSDVYRDSSFKSDTDEDQTSFKNNGKIISPF